MSAFTALQTNLDKMLNTENNKFNENAPVIYEIQNENTYVNIVDQTDKQYHVYFIDDEGCAIYVGANARSV